MKKLIVIAATILLSGSALATTVNASKAVLTQGYTSQAQAYEAGFDVIDQYQELSAVELSKALNMNMLGVDQYSFEYAGAEVKIEEFAQVRDELQYRAVVDVNYQYDNDN
ncbi:DUF3316 domain-containing protein [Alginatibacterium sediminis]|uniref:DUF3316 domain-containing protein n=1 Tax=Alginatibacterium sediminis TaxID=2164068 RepID=A0A420EN89_9ALTE|nr:DUF3316 domain-containing protein [Alginatibacterium sediminis]RKF22179.1 DUF3316 domain-containing protein [Alginatibacterium sediminis]